MSPRVILAVGVVALLAIAGLVLWAGEPQQGPAVEVAPVPEVPVAAPQPVAQPRAPLAPAPTPQRPLPAAPLVQAARVEPMAPTAPVSISVPDELEVETANVSAATRALEEAVRKSRSSK